MNLYKYKGKRIRASDKNLVYRFCVGTLLFLFIAVLLLLNIGQLMHTDWEHFSLLDNGVTLSIYNFITITLNVYTHLNYDDAEEEMQKVVELSSKKSTTHRKRCVS